MLHPPSDHSCTCCLLQEDRNQCSILATGRSLLFRPPSLSPRRVVHGWQPCSMGKCDVASGTTASQAAEAPIARPVSSWTFWQTAYSLYRQHSYCSPSTQCWKQLPQVLDCALGRVLDEKTCRKERQQPELSSLVASYVGSGSPEWEMKCRA